MGLFSRIGEGLRQMVGGVDAEVTRIGRPARAELLEVLPQGTTVRFDGGLSERVCDFLVEVAMAGLPPYRVQVRQRIPEMYLAWLRPGEPAAVSAKVHPRDPRRVALDFDTLLLPEQKPFTVPRLDVLAPHPA